MNLVFGSVCSGIEAASVAWKPLGWECAFVSEIEKFPSAVLAHHYGSNMPGEPYARNGVPNYGDMTNFQQWPDHGEVSDKPIDVLIGGTPCQSFSIAGLRKGLADPRGNLMLTYLAIAARYRPRWLVWENVPGVLSSEKGRDFGTFLGGLGKLGYGFSYRVLDAQYVRVDGFGRAVPQRRRRVFVVGHLGDWRRAAAVLFERESLCGHSAPRRQTGQGITADVAPCLKANGSPAGDQKGMETQLIPVPTIVMASGQANAEISEEICPTLSLLHEAPIELRTDQTNQNGSGISYENISGTPDGANGQAVAFAQNASGEVRVGDVANTLNTDSNASGRNTALAAIHCAQVAPTVCQGPPFSQTGNDRVEGEAIVAFSAKDYGGDASVGVSPTLRAGGHNQSHANSGNWMAIAQTLAKTAWLVRRLTPTECQRLQGFADGYTQIPWSNKPAEKCPDGPQYKTLGNTMAVNVNRWLSQRVEMVESMSAESEVA